MNVNKAQPWLLVIGMITGLLFAASGLVNVAPTMSKELVAIVNGKPITTSYYNVIKEQMLRRNPNAQQPQIMDNLIENELMLQKALELGLPESSPAARHALVGALKSLISNKTKAEKLDENDIKEFYQQNLDKFRVSGTFTLKQIQVSKKDRAQDAYQALKKGEPWSSILSQYEDKSISKLPKKAISEPSLRQYIGHDAVTELKKLSIGEYTQPHTVGDDYSIYMLVEKTPKGTPPLDKIRTRVIRQYQKQLIKSELNAFLKRLRKDANIQIREQ